MEPMKIEMHDRGEWNENALRPGIPRRVKEKVTKRRDIKHEWHQLIRWGRWKGSGWGPKAMPKFLYFTTLQAILP